MRKELENVLILKLKQNLQIQIKRFHQVASDDLKMIEMHELMQEYYHYTLKTVEGEAALNYLKERGFTDALIDARKIGYAPNNSHFVMILKKKDMIFN